MSARARVASFARPSTNARGGEHDQAVDAARHHHARAAKQRGGDEGRQRAVLQPAFDDDGGALARLLSLRTRPWFVLRR